MNHHCSNLRTSCHTVEMIFSVNRTVLNRQTNYPLCWCPFAPAPQRQTGCRGSVGIWCLWMLYLDPYFEAPNFLSLVFHCPCAPFTLLSLSRSVIFRRVSRTGCVPVFPDGKVSFWPQMPLVSQVCLFYCLDIVIARLKRLELLVVQLPEC